MRYCNNNPLRYTDPDGEFWHIVIGAVVGGVVNLVMNWNNCDGFWEYAAAFGIGAGAGALTAATGGAAGASFWATAGVSAAGSAATMGTNSVITQTDKNFSGMNNVDWGQVGISAAVGGVSGFAGSAAGYWASNSTMLINGINSPVLRSAVVSPFASGVGHIAGGTAAGLFQGQSLNVAFENSFTGLGQSMALGGAIGVSTTLGVSYAKGISPWTGKGINNNSSQQTKIQYDLTPDNNGENKILYRGMTGSEGNEGPIFFTDDPDYAASYAKQGYGVNKVTISNRTLFDMRMNGGLQINPNGSNYNNGVYYKGTEYMFNNNIRQQLILQIKP